MNNKNHIGVKLIGLFQIFGALSVLFTLNVQQTPSFNIRLAVPFAPETIVKICVVIFSIIIAYGYLKYLRWGYWSMLIYSILFCCISIIQIIKYGGQPFANEFLTKNFKDSYDSAFGAKNGKALLSATAGSLIGIINGNDFNGLSIEARAGSIKAGTTVDFKTYSKSSSIEDIMQARIYNKEAFYNQFMLPFTHKNEKDNTEYIIFFINTHSFINPLI